MLILFGLIFSQKWHRFLLAIGELGKPLTILSLTTCPLPWLRSLGSFARFWPRGHHLSLSLLYLPKTWVWQDIQLLFPSFPSFKDTCEWLVSKLPSRSSTSFLASSRSPSSFLGFSSFLSKDLLHGGWRTRLWPKFRSSSFWLFFFLSLSFFLGLWAFMVLLNFTSWRPIVLSCFSWNGLPCYISDLNKV